MIRLLTQLAVLPAILVCVAFTQPGGDVPTGQEVMRRFLEVTGGVERHAAIQNRIISGELAMPDQGFAGTFEQVIDNAGRARQDVQISGVGGFSYAHDGETGWYSTPFAGVGTMTPEQAASFVYRNRLGTELNADEVFTSVKNLGEREFADRPAWAIGLIGNHGYAETRFYDRETGRFLGAEQFVRDEMGEALQTLRILDWQEVDGLTLPSKLELNRPGSAGRIELTVTQVKHNAELDPSAFAKPQE